MSDLSDRLERIKAQRAEHDYGDPAYFDWLDADDFDWLIAEVKRLQVEEAVAWQKGYEQGYADRGQV